MSDDTRRVIEAAAAEGLLPPDASAQTDDGHPWPILLLTGLGAWLAAIPVIVALGMIFGDLLSQDLGPYLIGLPLLAGAVAVLRKPALPLFIEQLAIPALVVALGAIAFGLNEHLGDAPATGLLGILAVALAVLLPRGWLRVLLGFAAAALLTWALVLSVLSAHDIFRTKPDGRVWVWIALHLSLAVWLAGLVIQDRLGPRQPKAAAALEPLAAGWVIACLVGLCMLSGMTMLVGATMPQLASDVGGEVLGRRWHLGAQVWLQLVSSLLVLGSGLWAARRWKTLARPWLLGVGGGMAVLAWLLPTLGGAWLALIVTLITRRTWLATFAALALAWIIGSFYYQLQWTLAEKALASAAIGLLLGALARLGSRRTAHPDKVRQATDRWMRRDLATVLILLTLIATLGAANWQIWSKERLIAEGRQVYVALAPVDPRSLMQGDFMRLRFAIPGEIDQGLSHLAAAHPQVVARIDARGVATIGHLHDPATALAQDEVLLTLTPKNGRWTLVTDAWFFREGDAERWEAARFGEFRLMPDGAALLVGMADAQLRPIRPDTDEATSPAQ